MDTSVAVGVGAALGMAFGVGGMGMVVAGNRNDCLQQDAVGALMAALW